MKKHLLVDVDSVLLNYDEPFFSRFGLEYPAEGERHHMFTGYTGMSDDEIEEMVSQFNVSPEFATLRPFKSSDHYISRLRNEGFTVTAITACGNSSKTQELRKRNIDARFPDMIDELLYVEHLGSKLTHLKRFEGSNLVWVEDNVSNYLTGETLGLKSVLVKTAFNYHDHDHILEVDDWSEIYDIVKNHY